MGTKIIHLTSPEIGRGNERKCYLHPYDETKAIKVSYEQKIGRSKQTRTETKYYQKLLKRKTMNWRHLPRYFGEVETNEGKGFVVELVRDFDGNVSKSFQDYLDAEGIAPFYEELAQYRQYFLDHKIIFNYGMMPKNILRRRTSETEAELVLIDGLGDVTFIQFTNNITWFAHRRIRRRWDKFWKKYLARYEKTPG